MSMFWIGFIKTRKYLSLGLFTCGVPFSKLLSMAKTGKKKLFHNKNDKQKFKGQKRKRFERDIRPKKKRKMEGSQDKVL